LSADGRYLVFTSDSAGLYGRPHQRLRLQRWRRARELTDVFVLDRLDHSITQVSVASDGSQAIRLRSWDQSLPAVVSSPSPATRPTSIQTHPIATFISSRASASTVGLPLTTIQALSDDGQLLLTLECELTSPDTQRCEAPARLAQRLDRENRARARSSSTTGSILVAGSVSPDGNVLAYWATDDPVQGRREGHGGIFVHDRAAGTTARRRFHRQRRRTRSRHFSACLAMRVSWRS
jgi:hypothetical protein